MLGRASKGSGRGFSCKLPLPLPKRPLQQPTSSSPPASLSSHKHCNYHGSRYLLGGGPAGLSSHNRPSMTQPKLPQVQVQACSPSARISWLGAGHNVSLGAPCAKPRLGFDRNPSSIGGCQGDDVSHVRSPFARLALDEIVAKINHVEIDAEASWRHYGLGAP
jgi:hypothetical protein